MLYWHVARVSARRMVAYRGATFAGIITNTVFGVLMSYVLLAAFRARPTIGGFDAVDAVTFTFVTQGLLMVVGIFGSLDMAERIKSGDVALDFARPYDYQAWWGAVAYGRAFFYAWARGVPPFLVGALVFDLRVPATAATWPAFALGVALAVGIAFAWGFLLQLSAFWIVDVRGPSQMGWLAAQFLAGSIVPLVLLPDGLEEVVRLLPFAGMIQFPVEIFLGKHTGVGLTTGYLRQLVWLAVLLAAGRAVLARARRRVVIHGG